MLPTFFAALICGFIMTLRGIPAEGAAFSLGHLSGLLFLLVLAVNLVILLYDLNLKGS